MKRTLMCGEFTADNIGEKHVINGWVAKRRNLGGLIFCDIRDRSGIVQVVFNDDIPQELFDKADSLRSEFVVGISGTVTLICRQARSRSLRMLWRSMLRAILRRSTSKMMTMLMITCD